MVTVVAVACFLLLRRSFTQLTQLGSKAQLARILRGSFPIGLVLPVLAGLLSVQFVSCTHESYGAVVADLPYMMRKNQEQLGASLNYLLIALAVWALIGLGVAVLGRRRVRDGRAQSDRPDHR